MRASRSVRWSCTSLDVVHWQAYLASYLSSWMAAMWTLQDAKNRFSEVVDSALAGKPQEVTRRGKPAVVVLSAKEYARLVFQAGKSRGSFADHLLSFPGEEVPRAEVQPRDVSL